MNIFKKIINNKTGQAITEYVLVLLIVSAAAAAINTTYESTTNLISSLAKNINETNVQGDGSGGAGAATFVPPNAFTENTWGVIPLDAPELRASSGNSITTNSSTIDTVGSSNLDYDNGEDKKAKGKFVPVAYFMANQPATWDTLTVYDYSYDLDEGSDTALKKFWKIEKTGNLAGNEDLKYVALTPNCNLVDTCRLDNADSRWNTGGTEKTVFTQFTDLGGKNSMAYSNSRDNQLFEDGFCFGSAQQCLPRHLSNGYYKISLIVIDKDHNESALVEQNITIKPEGFQVSYKYEYGNTQVISKTPIDDSDGEEKRELVDHQYGLVTDLYGVKHPVIEMNMIRKYSTKRYIIKTRQERILCAISIDTNTGQEVAKECFDAEWIYSEKEIADGGNAGFDTEGDDVSGNLWEKEKLVDNDWVFYIYDKRSLFNKRFVGDNGKAIDLELKNDKGEFTSSGGATYIDSMSKFDEYNSLDGRNDTSEESHDWQNSNTALKSNFSSHKDPKNDTYIDGFDQLTIYYNSKVYPSADVNNSGAKIQGTNNTSYTGRDAFDDGPNTPSGNSPTTTVKKNAFASTSYIDFADHTDHPAYIAPAYERSCIKNCNNEEFEAIKESPEVSIMQLQSTYALLDDKMNNNEKTKKLVEPFDEAIYRNEKDDFSDGSTMYQLRTDLSGRDENGDKYITESDNDYDPEFISIRLSLNDFYGYNPGANMDTVKNATSEMKTAFQEQMSDTTKGLAYPTNYDYKAYKNNKNVGCNECTEPNFNVDGKMAQTEYRIVEGEVSPGGSHSSGSSCTATAYYPDVSMSEYMDARTRQYNWLEHAAFDWVYEYSGSGDGSAQKATSGARGNKTIKIRIAHWHTLGRSLKETTMGRYTDPYTTATKSNKPYAAVDMRGINSDINITTMNPDRFLDSMNPKSIFTSSDGQATNDDGDKDDGSGRRDMWRILSGSISTSDKDSDSCSYPKDCDCCSSTYHASAWAKTTITIKYNGLGEEEVSYDLDEGGSSWTTGSCCSCPKEE